MTGFAELKRAGGATFTGIELQQIITACWAFGDSWNDVPMLEAVGHPVAVNPGGKLQARARERGWEIAHWGGDV